MSVVHLMRLRLLVGILLMAFLMAGCSSIVRPGQNADTGGLWLSTENSLGQTFVSYFDGLNGIEVYLSPESVGKGEIRLHLRESAKSTKDLRVAVLPAEMVTAPGFYRFSFSPLEKSQRAYFYFFIRVAGKGQYRVGSAPGAVYLDGSAYENHQPLPDAQMTFQFVYHPLYLLRGLAFEVLTWGWYLIVAVVLFVLPGWALLGLLPTSRFSPSLSPHSSFAGEEGMVIEDFWTKLGLALGVSLGLYPVLLSFTDAVGLHIGREIAWGVPLLSIAVIFWRERNRLANFLKPPFSLGEAWKFHLLMAVVSLLVFAARFWIIRRVDIPLWADSIQHAVIAQRILESNGLFQSWAPYYPPYHSFTTHFGFSAFTALFAWLTNMNGTYATLWMGQIINGIAVLTLYPIAVYLSRGNRWAGLGSVFAAGLAFNFPAFYVNWGRFAQLTGQAILPVALWFIWKALEGPARLSLRRDGAILFLAGLILTGMALSYYRMPFYYATFVVMIVISWGLPRWKRNIALWRSAIARLLIVACLAGAMFLPWSVRLTGSNLAGFVEKGVTVGGTTDWVRSQFQTLRLADYFFPTWIGGVALLAVVWGLVRRNWPLAALPLWFALLIGYMAGTFFRFPGANMLESFAIVIALYIPAAWLFGWLFGEAIAVLTQLKAAWLLMGIGLVFMFVGAWLGWKQRLLLDLPAFQLVQPPDERAMQWISENTPLNSLFLVQGYTLKGSGVGFDGGYWTPLLANRTNTVPPQYAQFNEASTPSNHRRQVVDLIETLRSYSVDNPQGLEALCRWGITHIYHGQNQASFAGAAPLFQPAQMLAQPRFFTPIYHQDRVWIFALTPEACQ